MGLTADSAKGNVCDVTLKHLGTGGSRFAAAASPQMIERHSHITDSGDDPLVLLECLRVPPEFYHLEVESGNVSHRPSPHIYTARLTHYFADALKLWKDVAYSYIVKLKDSTNRTFSSSKSHKLVMYLATLIGDDNFSTSPIRDAANGKLRMHEVAADAPCLTNRLKRCYNRCVVYYAFPDGAS